jgi:hypothetical protein
VTLRNQKALTYRPTGVVDAIDGTNVVQQTPGTLQAAVNMVPSMHTRNLWVARPAIQRIIRFQQQNYTGEGEAIVEIGDRLWGFVQRGDGLSTPFCYNFMEPPGFVEIGGITDANLPVSTVNTGEWTPPTIAQVGARIIFTHPGFEFTPNAFGWVDMTGQVDSATGTLTAGSRTITALSKDTLLAGWRPGMVLSGPGIPTGATITAVSVDGLTVTMSVPATASGTVAIQMRGGTPINPLWGAGNLNVFQIYGFAQAVAMFNGRAWFANDNNLVFTDAGDPLQMTNANQVLTIQNGLKITALATQPFSNQTVTGGVVQGLVVFQGDAAIWQVTGDQAFGNLQLSYVSPVGTLAPQTIQTVPSGLRFIAPDGVRQIQLNGTVSDPIFTDGDGVAAPFINCPFPSRMCAAYNEDIYRVSVTGYTTLGGAVIPIEASGEYWLHEKLRVWSGPHSCPFRVITASTRPHTGHGFLGFLISRSQPVLGSGRTWVLGSRGRMLGTDGDTTPWADIYFSNPRQTIDSHYIEGGAPLSWVMSTTLTPDSGDMFMVAVVETSIGLGMPPEPQDAVAIAVYDEVGRQLDEVIVRAFFPLPGGTQLVSKGGIWGQAHWGVDVWGAEAGALFAQRPINWHTTLTFKQMNLTIQGQSNTGTAVGNIYLRFQRLGYMVQDFATLTTQIPQFGVTKRI